MCALNEVLWLSSWRKTVKEQMSISNAEAIYIADMYILREIVGDLKYANF